jgi:hypothetical protein
MRELSNLLTHADRFIHLVSRDTGITSSYHHMMTEALHLSGDADPFVTLRNSNPLGSRFARPFPQAPQVLSIHRQCYVP